MQHEQTQKKGKNKVRVRINSLMYGDRSFQVINRVKKKKGNKVSPNYENIERNKIVQKNRICIYENRNTVYKSWEWGKKRETHVVVYMIASTR